MGLLLCLTYLDVIPKLGCGEGLQEAGIRLWNADTVLLQELLGPIQALWGQFIVPKGAQELADQDVCLLWGLPVPHVCCHNGHHIFPPIKSSRVWAQPGVWGLGVGRQMGVGRRAQRGNCQHIQHSQHRPIYCNSICSCILICILERHNSSQMCSPLNTPLGSVVTPNLLSCQGTPPHPQSRDSPMCPFKGIPLRPYRYFMVPVPTHHLCKRPKHHVRCSLGRTL